MKQDDMFMIYVFAHLFH